MKSKFFLLILTFLFAGVCLGQEISKSDIIKFKIKSITATDVSGKITFTKFYNDRGDLTKQGSLNDNQELQITGEFFYNDSSQLIEVRVVNLNVSEKYYYNNKNQLSKKEYLLLGSVTAVSVFQYDEKGNRISETQTSETMGNALTKYKYDINNFLIQEDKSNNLIGKEETIKYKYSEKGKLIEKETKSYYFNTTTTLNYIYDDSDRLIKLVEKLSNSIASTTIYEYTNMGLPVSETWEDSLTKSPQKTAYQINFN